MSLMRHRKAEANVVGIFATIGSILVALGIAWIFISNWSYFSTLVKIVVLLGATGLSFGAACLLDSKGFDKTAQGVFLLTCLLWSLSVFIIAQQFNYGLSMQENANLALVSVIGIATLSYAMGSRPSLILLTITFYVWTLLQVASIEPSGFLTPTEAILYTSLIVMILYLFLGWIHRASERGFDGVYAVMAIVVGAIIVITSQSMAALSLFDGEHLRLESVRPLGVALILAAAGLFYRSRKMMDHAGRFTWAAAAAVLYTTLTYTHQYAQMVMGLPVTRLFSLDGFMFILVPVAFMAYAIAQVKRSKNITWFDLYAGLSIYGIYLVALTVLPLVLGTSGGSSVGRVETWAIGPIWSLAPTAILQWLIFNAMYIALVLYIISFADREGRSGLLRTSFFFFGLYLTARYIGFMTDLSGYLALSSLLIIGGLGLIGLSIGYHRFWKAKMG